MSPLAKRLMLLEARRGTPADYEVVIRGGLPNAKIDQAVTSDYVWHRGTHESEESFKSRVWHEARLEGIRFVAFGGLPVASYDLPE